MKTFRHYMPVDLHFGNGRLNDASLFNLPFHKALIITGKESTEGASHAFSVLLKNLESQSILYVIDDSITHPLSKQDIQSAIETAKENNCDFVVGFGGGKTLDAAKLVARFIKEEFTLFDGWMKSQMIPPFENSPMYLLSIPTSFNNASALNPKAFLYDLQRRRQVRFKHESLFPNKAIIDPSILITLPSKVRFNPVIETFIRAIELIIGKYSLMHTWRAKETLKVLIRYAPALNKDPLDEDALHHITYALVNLYQLYLPKPWFPLNQISDAIEGYHEHLPNGAFITEAAIFYLNHRLETITPETSETLKNLFKDTAFDSANLYVSIGYFFNALKFEDNQLKKYGLELALVSDYMVHLKTIYPDFQALSNDALYDIIERTLIGE